MKREINLGKDSIPKLMIQLIIPAIFAQLVSSLYSVVDRMFIGHIEGDGEFALAGIGITTSIIGVISAVNALVGNGGAPLFSMSIGKGSQKEAEKILGSSVAILVVSSVILTIFFMIFNEPLLLRFGASENTLVYAQQYLKIYLIGTIFSQLTFGLNPFISVQGKATVAMGTTLIGAIANIILDLIFIYVFDLGIRGAAIATVTAQALSAIWVVTFLTSSKSGIRIKKKNIRLDKKVVISIISLGMTPFVMHFTESIVSVVINRGLEHYGNDMYVSTMAIILSVYQMLLLPVWGVTGGVQAIISFNYGAGNMERVRTTCKLLVGVVMCMTTIVTIATIVVPRGFVGLFTGNAELIDISAKMLPIYFMGVWAFGAQTSCQSILLSLGQAKVSMFLALLRKVFLLIPLAIIFPKFFGVTGIFYAQPIADIVASLVTAIIVVSVLTQLLRNRNRKETSMSLRE